MNVLKKYFELIEEDMRITVSDGILYSLILRLREWYIVECPIRDKRQSKKELIQLVRDIDDRMNPIAHMYALRMRRKMRIEPLLMMFLKYTITYLKR